MINSINKITDSIYEMGCARRIKRSHQQFIGLSDDSISDHTFRVAWIAMIIGGFMKADTGKIAMLSLIHDIAEVRTGDFNLVTKQYVKCDEEKAFVDQIDGLPNREELLRLFNEYSTRTTLESIIVKDSDLIEQITLEREYSERGVTILDTWHSHSYNKIKLDISKKIADKILTTSSFNWRNTLLDVLKKN